MADFPITTDKHWNLLVVESLDDRECIDIQNFEIESEFPLQGFQPRFHVMT